MYARLVTMSGADAGKREAALEMINGTHPDSSRLQWL